MCKIQINQIYKTRTKNKQKNRQKTKMILVKLSKLPIIIRIVLEYLIIHNINQIILQKRKKVKNINKIVDQMIFQKLKNLKMIYQKK